MAVRLGQNVWRLSRSGERVESAKRELALAQAENDKLNKQLEIVKDPEFALGEAREKLGLGKPGEVVVILPSQSSNQAISNAKSPENILNWKLWWDEYIGI